VKNSHEKLQLRPATVDSKLLWNIQMHCAFTYTRKKKGA